MTDHANLKQIPGFRSVAASALALLLASGLPPVGFGTTASVSAQSEDPGVTRTKRDNLAKLLRPITLDVTDQALGDIMTFITDFTGAEIEPRFADDRNPDGLDPETLISIDVKNIPTLRLLELVLEQAARDSFESATWQFTPWGSVEVGLKSTLNRRQRVQIYDISDLLLVLPDYEDAPEIDLQSVLQSSQGGGGGQSPFDDAGGQDDEERDLQERRDTIIDLIQSIVQPEQWQANGGDGGSIRIYQNALVVRAADYIHREIDGYSFWPSSSQSVSGVGGRRYVSFTLDTGISTIDGFRNVPVTATAGGQGGGGGG